MQTDFLVIGSGIAGITYALKVAEKCPDKKVTIITKTTADETNTKYAQGGIAVVNDLENDSFDKHIEDTLISGDGLCNEKVVEIVVTEGPARVNEIIAWGADFDKDAEGDYKRGKEGGHSENRILHHKDVTGKEIERALLKAIEDAPNIELLNHCFVVDIITQHHLGYLVTKSTTNIECFGVYVLNLRSNQIEKIKAKITLLATGGNGQAYRTTTNPAIATGDGGILRNIHGEAFMERYDKRKDLAPRDIVARAIDSEMKRNGTEHVYLDCRHFDKEKFVEHFPNIYSKCLSIGIDITKQMIPVAPAAHYSCGGIKTDEWGRTSIQHLYACGECASTGLHGANRLASNSLLEALVFAHRCFIDATNTIADIQFNELIPDWNAQGTSEPKEMILITQSLKEVQMVMSDYVGIVRNDVRLQRAMRRLDLLFEETQQLYQSSTLSPQLLELRNLITVGYLVVKGATLRKESRGLHFNTDYPGKSALVQNIVL